MPLFVLFIFVSFQLGKQTADLSIIPMRLDALFSSGIAISYELTEDGFNPASETGSGLSTEDTLQASLDSIGDYVAPGYSFKAVASIYGVPCTNGAAVPDPIASVNKDGGLGGTAA